MLDTHTIIVILYVLFYKKIHVSACQSFLFVIVRSHQDRAGLRLRGAGNITARGPKKNTLEQVKTIISYIL